MALDFCFSPYVHSLEWISIKAPSCITPHAHADANADADADADANEETTTENVVKEHRLIKAQTRNIFALPVETVFDPYTDVINENVAKKNNRPFCNFIAKGVPLYVHPNLVLDEELRVLLVGAEKAGVAASGGGEEGAGAAAGAKGAVVEGNVGKKKKKQKEDDDDFL